MTNKNIVNIHGKDYMTVAGRVEQAHKECTSLSISTEIISHDPILIKATVVTNKGTFTGYSANYAKGMIEKQSPYEVCETSAIGRALGFAGFGIIDGVASADEIVKAESEKPKDAIDRDLGTLSDDPMSIVASKAQVAKIQIELKRTGVDKQKIYDSFKVTSLNDLTKQEASKVIEKLVAKTVNSSVPTVNHEN